MKMRIDENTIAYHDIIWFACDRGGRIMVAHSNEGMIPDFVVADRDRAQWLAQRLCGQAAIDRGRKYLDYEALAARGFYCFANKDPFDGAEYALCAKPQKPLVIGELESEVKELLLAQAWPVNLTDCERFSLLG